ncbi:hypothetical protein P389DRAFT_46204 [Cystobasidium minutum MCA 4210]|uniref:uncharacterized protein n=1 Tax=Cystobasidium minutum MCA 4210 TaxID=1397322 RepID=UPI0034CFE994|eukprot:jgi/Rhomi1/46204/CE46203_105
MRLSATVLPFMAFYYATASPLSKRQEDSDTAIVDTPVTLSEPPVIPSAEPSPIDSVLSPIIDTPTSPTPPRSSPSPQPATPDPEDDCPPCEDEPLFTSESPSGKVCYCLGGGQKGRNNGDRQPWAWGGPFCQYGSDGAGLDVSEDEKPQICSGNGAIPASRECLNQCNFMLTTVNSANPCSPNVVNAANACARCTGANMFVQTGKEATGTYMNGPQVAAKLIDGLQGWCAKPNRCYDLKGGKKISGQGGCPVLAVNNPVAPPPSVVTTNTRSFTDLNGRPTFAIELLTVADPNFTANTEFAGSRPTGAAGTGAATGRFSGILDISVAISLLLLGVVI